MSSQTELTVRYAETDQMGVVHHSRYFVWLEMARTDYIRSVGMSYSDMEKAGVMLPVTGVSCKYRLPARYDDEIVVTVRITRLTPARIEFEYTITRKGETDILAVGTSSHGFVDSTTFKPLNFKRAMPDLYEKMAKCAEEDSPSEQL